MLKFGDRCWFVSVFPLKEKTYDRIKEQVEKVTADISKHENIDEADIGFLRWRTKTEFSNTAKEGDQVILKYNNESKTRSFVYPPSAILKKEVVNGFTYIYHDTRHSEARKIAWTIFQVKIKQLSLDKAISTRTKIISEEDVVKLKPLWKRQR